MKQIGKRRARFLAVRSFSSLKGEWIETALSILGIDNRIVLSLL
ncbi:hypothetical protein LEP1GSC046_1920 [Leptospira kirschneri serovar Bim str. 1051]|nr:hypothetical protein LEP1GSC042_3502 [Leptospira kirschneri serovar Bim str. PUO 1247]EMN03081.1 hypothetical protein LEP1GSC046_1920 [Leptospira kirschneri serovar Bim str. 1051]